MDGQEARGWREVRIREEEQYLYRETCLTRTLGGAFGGDPGKNFCNSLLGGPGLRGGQREFTAGETADPTGRVLSVKWDMYPGWLPEEALPLQVCGVVWSQSKGL